MRKDNDRPATIKDVRDKLSNALRRQYVAKDGTVKTVRHLQPVVSRIVDENFLIRTPYFNCFHQPIRFFLCRNRQDEDWLLFSDVDENSVVRPLLHLYHSKAKQFKKMYRKFTQNLMIEYAVDNSKHDINNRLAVFKGLNRFRGHPFYIEISDRSLQDAFYRLVEFEIEYCGVIKFLYNY